MAETFIQAYAQARARMDELKVSVRGRTETTVMDALIHGKPVMVTKGFKAGGEVHSPGEEFHGDPALLHRYEVLVKNGYFTTVEQWALNREWNANKQIYEKLDSAYRKWDDANMARLAAQARLFAAEAELAAAKGNLQDAAAQLKKAEAEGLKLFSQMNKKN
jgi:hypothetical protein